MSTETIAGLLALRADSSRQVAALIDNTRSITYGELDRQSADLAAWLVSQGVNKGHRVGLLMPNGVAWAINAYAVMRIGAVLVPLSTLLRPMELQSQLATAGARHLIACEQFRGRDYRQDLTSSERQKLPFLTNVWWSHELEAKTGDHPAEAVAQALAAQLRPADEMVVIFTSGSSGPPKGVIHTHGAALRANAASLADRGVAKGERLYLPMPFFWVGGFAGGLISALNAGATLLTEAVAQPAQTLAFLEQHRATLFRGWPDQAAQMIRDPAYSPDRLATLKPGSLDALLPPEKQVDIDLRANLFGMTETFGPYCSHPLDQPLPADKKGSCGRPVADMQLRIVDPDTGALQAHGSIGRIQLRSANMLKGLCGHEREEIFSADGWYDGGDLGWLDDDGYLYFSGRRDDMLKIKGVSVYPSEVTTVLESLPGVSRAFVTAVQSDQADVLGAALVPSDPEHCDLHAIQQACREQLSAFKIPTVWKVLGSFDELPKLTSGKIDKAALRSLLES